MDHMLPACATHDEIVAHFLTIPYTTVTSNNWMTARDNSIWHVPGTDSYINGVLLTVDLDFEMGYCLEVVDRTPGTVNFVVVVTTAFGRSHDSSMYDKPCGTFFERTDAADRVTVSHWAVTTIYYLIESIRDADRKTREKAAPAGAGEGTP